MIFKWFIILNVNLIIPHHWYFLLSVKYFKKLICIYAIEIELSSYQNYNIEIIPYSYDITIISISMPMFVISNFTNLLFYENKIQVE